MDHKTEYSLLDQENFLIEEQPRNTQSQAGARSEGAAISGGPTVPLQGQEPRLGSEAAPTARGSQGSLCRWRGWPSTAGDAPQHPPPTITLTLIPCPIPPHPIPLRRCCPHVFSSPAAPGFSPPEVAPSSLRVPFGRPRLLASQKYQSACCIAPG